MAKKTPWRKWRDICDAVHSLYVRARDNRRYGGVCAICRRNPIEVAFHFIGRAALLCRWHDDNVVGSCSWCNRLEMQNRTAADRAKWRAIHVALIGEERRAALEAMEHRVANYSAADLEELAGTLKAKLKNVWTEAIWLGK